MTDLDYIAELLDDLFLVGIQKLLGYLPLCTISEICDKDPIKLKESAEAKGLKTKFVYDEPGFEGRGALYVYDAINLNNFLFLDQNKSILARNNWPENADDFVNRVISEQASDKFLYDLIAQSFNDTEYLGHDYNPYDRLKLR